MRKNIFVFGSIAGLIVGLYIVYLSFVVMKDSDVGDNAVIGYSAMVIAFAFIFVGVKNYRDKYNGGLVSFGRALTIGLGITLIASTIYVIVWLIDYYVFIPDFMDKYAAHMIKEAQTSGLSQADLAKKMTEIDGMKSAYKNPVYVVLFTYLEIVPVGIVISLLTALFLKRKHLRSAAPVVA